MSIGGGVDEFNAFVKTVIVADNEWDINFQTSIKYLVARYNHFATRERVPTMLIRHSYLETNEALTQQQYDLFPIEYIETTVLTFGSLYPTANEEQFITRLEASKVKSFYSELVIVFQTYKDYYLEIVEKCIDMLVPASARLTREFKNDVEVFSSTLTRQFPHFSVDKTEFLRLLYHGILEKGTFSMVESQSR